MRPWWNKYVGLPYRARGRTDQGLDCYGLLIRVYHNEFGIELFDYLRDSESTPDGKLFEDGMTSGVWMPSPRKQEGDVAVYSMMNTPFHTVILIPSDRMLHCTVSSGVVAERISSGWSRRLVGVFRHVQMCRNKP